MNVYYITGFPGHYPVGTSAVIVAPDRVAAFGLLQIALKKHGLDLDIKDVSPKQFIQLDTILPHAVVLQDGDY